MSGHPHLQPTPTVAAVLDPTDRLRVDAATGHGGMWPGYVDGPAGHPHLPAVAEEDGAGDGTDGE